MNIKIFVPLTAQNFAVAPARRTETREEEKERLRELEERVRECHAHWFQLFGELDVWSNETKRRAMMEARWAYHDAAAEWRTACENREDSQHV